MPGLSGLQLAHKLEAERPSLPILLATGYSEELREDPGAFAVVSKPYDATSLAAAIGTLLEARKGRAA
jgi:CheY-like chemotaxis protein